MSKLANNFNYSCNDGQFDDAEEDYSSFDVSYAATLSTKRVIPAPSFSATYFSPSPNQSSDETASISGSESSRDYKHHDVFPDAIYETNENDVLCGRGKGSNDYIGNCRFRALVGKNREGYASAKRSEKPLIALKIVHTIGNQGGRFLKYDKSAQCWHTVPQDKAVEKTSQALREGARIHQRKRNIQRKRKTHEHSVKHENSSMSIRTDSLGMQEVDTYPSNPLWYALTLPSGPSDTQTLRTVNGPLVFSPSFENASSRTVGMKPHRIKSFATELCRLPPKRMFLNRVKEAAQIERLHDLPEPTNSSVVFQV